MSELSVTFLLPDGRKVRAGAAPGESLLDAARLADVAIEGACGGAMACATCHVVLEEADFERLPEPSDEEEDMLDLAQEVTSTSRLGCQVKLRADLNGLTVEVPRSSLLD